MNALLRFALFVIALSMCALRSHGEELSLQAAIDAAVGQNPELQASRKQIEANMGHATQASLWPNPEIEITSEDIPPGRGGFSSALNSVGVSQTIPFPRKKALDGRIAQKGADLAESEYARLQAELIRDVKIAFYRVLAANQKMGVAQDLVGLAESLSEVAAKRVRAGATSDQELLRAELERERVVVDLSAARTESAEAEQHLATLMGEPLKALGTLQGALPESTSSPELEQALDKLLARHPSVRAAVIERERAELEVERAKLEPLPDVTFGVSGGRDFENDETLMTAGISFPLPLLDRSQGRKREAGAEAAMARHNLTAVENNLVEQLRSVQVRLRAANEQAEAYRTRILPKSEEALRLVRGGFDAGKYAFFDLVDTQRTAAEVRLKYYETLLDLNSAHAQLEALLLTDLAEPPAGDGHSPKPQ